MSDLGETILQFGTGNFLRAFVDVFVHEANAAGHAVGRVVAVQQTGGERAAQLNRKQGRYHVVVRGLTDGARIDRVQPVESISRALVADTQWDEVLALAGSPDLRWIVSNATEAGYALAAGDGPDDAPPQSFPAKLAVVLAARFQADCEPVTVLPCELVEPNAARLRELVLAQARQWAWPASLLAWIEREVGWRNTLVDRIVSGRPDAHPLLATDALLTAAEPYALWAIEDPAGGAAPFTHPAMQCVTDVAPYALRKVRILNGAHTALVCKAMPAGFETVREAVEDEAMGAWLRRLLFDEIVPVLEGRVEDPAGFALETLERFANPFLEHKLSAIALHHDAKLETRLVPTVEEHVARFGRPPALLTELLGG